MPIEYKSHIELFRNWSVHEFYCLKALITSEQVITSVVEKKNNLYQQNFEVYTGKPGSRIGDWELGIGDRGSLIPEKGRKIRILLLLYKKFDPNNQFLYFIDHYPLLFESLYVLPIVVTPSFSLLLMSFCFFTVASLQSRVKQQISWWCREMLLLWRVPEEREQKCKFYITPFLTVILHSCKWLIQGRSYLYTKYPCVYLKRSNVQN